MYTLHKLLKGGRVGGRRGGKSSEPLTRKENEDIVNILAPKHQSWNFWEEEGGGLCDSRRVGEKTNEQVSMLFFTGECSTRHQLRQLLANK